MKLGKFFTALLMVCVMAAVGYAEEKSWSDEAELSYVDIEGNSDFVSLSAKNLLKYTFTDELKGAWKLAALEGKADNVKIAESYFTEFRLDYLYTDLIYFAGIAGWFKNTFAGIESRYYIGPAVGYKWLTGPKHFITAEAGLNYVSEEYINNTEEDYLQGRAFGLYEYPFNPKNKFSQSLEFLYDFEDSDNYNMNSVTALTSALSDYFSLKTSYEIKYDHEPVPSTLKKTDTILALTLVVNF
jgi:putative salt-induced outer membrane protein